MLDFCTGAGGCAGGTLGFLTGVELVLGPVLVVAEGGGGLLGGFAGLSGGPVAAAEAPGTTGGGPLDLGCVVVGVFLVDTWVCFGRGPA